MSYVLQIWAFPMPQSIGEVDGILADLSRRPRKPTTLFVELARRLTARHPCITTLEEDDENAVWTDGPMDGRTDEPYWGIGILSQHIDTVQPFVVEAATAMGFVVHDDQAGECHLPGGITLTPEGRGVGRHLGLPVPEVMEPRAVQRLLEQALESAAAPLGFRPDTATGALARPLDFWTHHLAVRVTPPPAGASGRAAEEWLCDAELAWGHAQFAKLWAEFDRAAVQAGFGGTQRYRATARTLLSRLAFWGRRRWPVLATRRGDNTFVARNADELRQVAVALRQVVAVEMTDMLNVIRSTEQLAFWCLSADTNAWKPYPLLQSTPTGLQKITLQRYLVDTEGCGNALTQLMLAAAGAHPDLPKVLAQARAWARSDSTGVMLQRVDLYAQALREAGMLPA